MTDSATEETRRICPGCLGLYRVTSGGRMYRHGFTARSVRHNAHSGFHTGLCVGVGYPPIGTKAGNRYALQVAAQADATAGHLEAKPDFTIDDATKDTIRLARAQALARSQSLLTAEQRDRFSTVESFAGTPWHGWFNRNALEVHRKMMGYARADAIVQVRKNAIELRKAVAENPAA